MPPVIGGAPPMTTGSRRLILQAMTRSIAPDSLMRTAKFGLGAVVRHRIYPFRGIVFDIDPVFDNTEEWWLAIPEEVRPRKDQPFYHLLAENAESEYVAYVSEQNLVPDTSGEALRHTGIAEVFERGADGSYRMRGAAHAN
jgi:heat shock protein HspQ